MADKDSYEIRHMTGQDLETAIEWAAKEGWNPGLADARSFQAADRNGERGAQPCKFVERGSHFVSHPQKAITYWGSARYLSTGVSGGARP